MSKKLPKRLLEKWQAYYSEIDQKEISKSVSKRFIKWVNSHQYQKPVDLEKFKYYPKNIYKTSRWWYIIPAFIGFNCLCVFDRLYKEDKWLLEKGKVIPFHKAWIYYVIRSSLAKISAVYCTTFELSTESREKGLTEVMFFNDPEIIQAREKTMKAFQISNYKSKRIDLFDHLYIGELEDLVESV